METLELAGTLVQSNKVTGKNNVYKVLRTVRTKRRGQAENRRRQLDTCPGHCRLLDHCAALLSEEMSDLHWHQVVGATKQLEPSRRRLIWSPLRLRFKDEQSEIGNRFP